MTKCIDIEQRLLDLLDGSIDGERRAECELHLVDCPTCRQLLADYQPLFDRLNDNTVVKPPQELWYRLQDKINRMEENRSSRLHLPVRWRPVISLSIRSLGLDRCRSIWHLFGKNPGRFSEVIGGRDC